MGFKCPVCSEDFKRNKDEWENHVKKEHQGAGKDMDNLVRKLAREKDEKDS